MKAAVSIWFCFLFIQSKAQNIMVLPVDTKGRLLSQFYHGLNVTGLWLAGHHVNNITGQADSAAALQDTTSQSALFTTAVCQKLHICFFKNLQPKKALTVNMQAQWLSSAHSPTCDWQQIAGEGAYITAQKYANKGYVVLAVFKSQSEGGTAQAAFINPFDIPVKDLTNEGPQVIFAGPTNANNVPLKKAFAGITSWPPNNISFFYYTQVPELNLEK